MSVNAVLLATPMVEGRSYVATYEVRDLGPVSPFGFILDRMKEKLWDACAERHCTLLSVSGDESTREIYFAWRYDGTDAKIAPALIAVIAVGSLVVLGLLAAALVLKEVRAIPIGTVFAGTLTIIVVAVAAVIICLVFLKGRG